MPSTTQSEPQSTPTQRFQKRKPTKATLAIDRNTDDENPTQPLKKARKPPTKKKEEDEATLEIDCNTDEDENPTKPLKKARKAPVKKNEEDEATIDCDTDDEKPSQPLKKARKAPVKENEEDDVDKPAVRTPRAANYNSDEDVQICRSWLEITEDPLNSTNQTANTFWARVQEHYSSKLTGGEITRSFDSIKKRWQLIQHAVNKCNGCYKQVKSANKSGSNNDLELSQALKLYEATNKGTSAKTKNRLFGHLQCWHILAPSAKFNAYCADLEDKALGLDGANLSEIPTSEATDGSNRTERPGKSNRPIGTRKAKDEKAEEAQDSKWKAEMVKVHRDLAVQSQAQNKILAEQKEAVIAMADESIMKINLDTISGPRRAFFEWKQTKMMEKMIEQQKAEEDRKKKEEEDQKNKEENDKKKKEEEKKKKEEEEEEDKEEEKKKIEEEELSKKKTVTKQKNTQKTKTAPKKTIAQVRMAAAKESAAALKKAQGKKNTEAKKQSAAPKTLAAKKAEEARQLEVAIKRVEEEVRKEVEDDEEEGP
ncbi:hypothetical protein PSTG_12860 [Puccinia striiformis f. sp. tritici PST-78]|uniref:No apical meristem-associated C-terminal domain-containing protein n=1 Tax=Puccinia striiformis f. sp. tritici PST-78 TaxID=1165861 RepID=A0A0L0V398_9BASI|nr:hypothetical protein PSTG_12860 [Puccinia striiformis f. sp. tritici PST-78]